MMAVALLAASKQPDAAPQPEPVLRNAEAVISPGDYPPVALRHGRSGIVSLLLGVSSGGRVTSCAVTETTGFAPLDAKTCDLFARRARFDPARDASGAAIASDFRVAASWVIDERQLRTGLDMVLRVAASPPAYRAPVKARLTFGEDGHVTDCSVTVTSGGAAADKVACDYARHELTTGPVRNGAGAAAATAIRYLTATLSPQPAASTAGR